MRHSSRSVRFMAWPVAVALCLAVPAIFAADNDKATQKISDQDQKFVSEAWIINTAEVELGHLAVDKATNADVKAFANQMIENHTKANHDLAQLVNQVQGNLPNELDQPHKDMAEKLGKLSGAEFDKEYMNAMINGHAKALEFFQKEAADKANTAVDQWAAAMVPALKEHLAMAEKTGKAVGATAGDLTPKSNGQR